MATKTAFDRWIFDSFEVSAEGLGLYRIFYAAFVLLLLTPGHSPLLGFTGAANLPAAFFQPPPGPMMLFTDFPPPWVATSICLLLNLSLVALLVGYRTRTASIATGTLMLLGYGLAFSAGKINHVMLFALLPIVMAASNWGVAYSLDAQRHSDAQRNVHAWPLTMMALLVGFGMFTAGFSKLLGGWLDPTTQATYGHFVKHFFVRGRQDLLAPVFASVDSVLFWEVLDVATVLFEMGFLAAAFHPATTRLFAACAVLFHFSTMMMFNISFAIHLPVYAAFVNWTSVAQTATLNPETFFSWIRRRWKLASGLGGSVAVLFYGFGSPQTLLDRFVPLSSDLTATEVLAVSAAALGLLLYVILRLLPDRYVVPRRADPGRHHTSPGSS